jgi:hypothetical protein
MELLYTSIVLFGLAALIGIYLISHVLQNKLPPKSVALAHGAVAATALILLIVYIYNTGADLVQAVVLFVIVALGGIALFVRHLTGKTLPKWLALTHASLAVISFVILLAYTFKK